MSKENQKSFIVSPNSNNHTNKENPIQYKNRKHQRYYVNRVKVPFHSHKLHEFLCVGKETNPLRALQTHPVVPVYRLHHSLQSVP